jgi:alanine transaminase
MCTAGRDGFPAEPKDIYLSAGASSGVNTLLHIICAGSQTGVLVPIPQYPLYTATLAVLNATCVPYYLEESKAWGTDVEAIKAAHKKAVSEGTDVRAIVIINPGNPTGSSLSEEDVKAVIDFAAQERLVILADEVYQTNVFIGEFHSFKGVLRKMQKADPEKYKYVELASLHSVSKGMVGECGHRGGYFELCGFDPEVVEQIYKFVSITLCSPVVAQCLVEMMVNPPKEGEPSYELYKQEYDGIFTGLQKRATALYEAFKQMEGVECQEPRVRSNLPLPAANFYLISLGLHVPIPYDQPATKGRRGRQEGVSIPGRVLRIPTSRCHRNMRRSWLWVRPEGGHPALQNHVPCTRHRMGGADHQVPQGVHG